MIFSTPRPISRVFHPSRYGLGQLDWAGTVINVAGCSTVKSYSNGSYALCAHMSFHLLSSNGKRWGSVTMSQAAYRTVRLSNKRAHELAEMSFAWVLLERGQQITGHPAAEPFICQPTLDVGHKTQDARKLLRHTRQTHTGHTHTALAPPRWNRRHYCIPWSFLATKLAHKLVNPHPFGSMSFCIEP